MPTTASVVLLDATSLNADAATTSERLEVEIAMQPETTVANIIEDLQAALAAMHYASTVPLDHRAGLALVFHSSDGTWAAGTDDGTPWSPLTADSWISAVAHGDSTGIILCGSDRPLENPVVLASLSGATSQGVAFRVVPVPAVVSATSAAVAFGVAPPALSDYRGDASPCAKPHVASSERTSGNRTTESAPVGTASGAEAAVAASEFTTPGAHNSTRPASSACASGPVDGGVSGDALEASHTRIGFPSALAESAPSLEPTDASRTMLMARGVSPFDTHQWTNSDDRSDHSGLTGPQPGTLPPALPHDVRAARAALDAAMQREYAKLDGAFPGATELQSSEELSALRHKVLIAMAEEAAVYEAETSRLRHAVAQARKWEERAVVEATAQVDRLEAQVAQRRCHLSATAQLKTQLSLLQTQLAHHRDQEVHLLQMLKTLSPAKGTRSRTPRRGQTTSRNSFSESTEDNREAGTDEACPPTPPHSAVDNALRRALRPSAPSSGLRDAQAGQVWLSSDSESSDDESYHPPAPTAQTNAAKPGTQAGDVPLTAQRVPLSRLSSSQSSSPAPAPTPSESASESAPTPLTHAQVQFSSSTSSSETHSSYSSGTSPPMRSPGPIEVDVQRRVMAADASHGWLRSRPETTAQTSTVRPPPARLSSHASTGDSFGDEGSSSDDRIDTELGALRHVTTQLTAHLSSPHPDPRARRQLLHDVRRLRHRLDAQSIRGGRRDPLRRPPAAPKSGAV